MPWSILSAALLNFLSNYVARLSSSGASRTHPRYPSDLGIELFLSGSCFGIIKRKEPRGCATSRCSKPHFSFIFNMADHAKLPFLRRNKYVLCIAVILTIPKLTSAFLSPSPFIQNLIVAGCLFCNPGLYLAISVGQTSSCRGTLLIRCTAFGRRRRSAFVDYNGQYQ